MKRFALIIAAILCITFAQAQHDTLPYYVGVPQFYMEHSIYDETYGVFSNYRWGFGDLSYAWLCSGDFLRANGYTLGNNELALRFVTDTTLHVIGIATPIPSCYTETVHTTSDHFDIGEHLSNLYRILNHEHEEFDSIWFNIYQPLDSHMTLLKSTMLDTTFDTANARLYLPTYGTPLSGTPSNDNFVSLGGRGFMWWQPQLMLEVYFDSELDLSDSFYVSYRIFGEARNGESMILNMTGANSTDYFNLLPFTGLRQKRIGATADDPWHYDEVRCYPLLFPIIRRDCDSCPQVRGLQYIKAGSNKAIFKWQQGTNHHDWQLSYGPAGTAPEDGTIVDYNQRMSSSIVLNPDSHYVAYVRARCRFARYEYGPWSDPLTFSLNGGIDGIDEVSSGTITLTPNPAADRVTVAAEGMESVELIGTDGAVLLRKECRGECVLDLAGLASGIYMVRVSTPTGTATKRLVVQ